MIAKERSVAERRQACSLPRQRHPAGLRCVLMAAFALVTACQAPASPSSTDALVEDRPEASGDVRTTVGVPASTAAPTATTGSAAADPTPAVASHDETTRGTRDDSPPDTTHEIEDTPADPLCSDIELPATDPVPEQPLATYQLDNPPAASDSRRTVSAAFMRQAPGSAVELEVTINDETGTEAVHILPMWPSTESHPSLWTRPTVRYIVIAPDRWFVPVSLQTTLASLDTVVRGHPSLVSQSLSFDGIRPNWDEHGNADGLRVSGWASATDDDKQHFMCHIPWYELGITEDLYDKYGREWPENKYRPRLEELSGFIWTARWGEEPVRAELADNRGKCCWIDVLDGGFVAISSIVTSEYSTAASAPLVHYSTDGIEWGTVVLPTYVFHYYEVFGPAEVPIWVCSVQSTDSGVLIREAAGDAGYGYSRPGCGEGTYWSADKDWTNWRKLLAPPPGYG